MATRNMPDGVSHGHYGEPKREGDTIESNPKLRKCSCQHCTAASAKHQPKCPKKLRDGPLSQTHCILHCFCAAHLLRMPGPMVHPDRLFCFPERSRNIRAGIDSDHVAPSCLSRFR